MTEHAGSEIVAAAKPHFMTVEPVLAVRDVTATTDYYREVLGFEDVWTWGDPPTHGGANSDGVQIQFSLNPAKAEMADGCNLWIRVRDVVALHARHHAHAANIVEGLEPKPWGVTEYAVRDLNGYRLRFAGSGGARERGSG